MPDAKDNPNPLLSARLVFVAGVAVLVGLVVWVTVRTVVPSDDRRPAAFQPSPPASSPAPPPTSTPAPSPSASPSRSIKPSPSRTRHRSPSASPSPTHPAAPTRKPTPTPTTLSATVTVNSTWNVGYVATVVVANSGATAVPWSVSVGHSGGAGVRLVSAWSASGSQQGGSLMFGGGTLDPGQKVTFGYQAMTSLGAARPSGCSVVGGSCHVS